MNRSIRYRMAAKHPAVRFVRRLAASFQYDAAVRHAIKQRYVRAERSMERAFWCLGEPFPSHDVEFSFNLFMALVKLRVGDNELAESGAIVAKDIVYDGDAIPADLRRYVVIYADRVIRVSRWKRDMSSPDVEDEPPWEEVEKIKARVPQAFRSIFTLPKPVA